MLLHRNLSERLNNWPRISQLISGRDLNLVLSDTLSPWSAVIRPYFQFWWKPLYSCCRCWTSRAGMKRVISISLHFKEASSAWYLTLGCTSFNFITHYIFPYTLCSSHKIPGGTSGKEPAYQCRRWKETQVWCLGQEDPLEKEMALQYSCLENPLDRGAWQSIVHRVAKSWTQLIMYACNHNNNLFSHLFSQYSSEIRCIISASQMIKVRFIDVKFKIVQPVRIVILSTCDQLHSYQVPRIQ